MYESHFGFSGSPFQLNPDPAFYFNSKGHSRAMGYLQYGVMQGEGFIVITGEIGAGKTTLLRTLLEGLDRQKVLAAQIVSTQLESGELLQAIITAFGIPAQGSSKAHLIATLEAFLTALAAQGRHALLIVDEAQNLNERAVEELRMLSNFQLGNHALLQSFLVGQPELRRLLESPQLEQLRQRVIASQHLGPLGPEETQAYVEHRLRHVGWTNRPVFAPGAFDHIYAWAGGVPRRINRLANRLLLASYLENTDLITPELVEQTALELRTEIGESSYQPLPLPVREPQTAPVVAESATAAAPAASAAAAEAPAVAPEGPPPADEVVDAPVVTPADPTPATAAEPAVAPSTPRAEEPEALVDAPSEAGSVEAEPLAEQVEPPAERPVVSEVDERLRSAAAGFELPNQEPVRTRRGAVVPGRHTLLCVADGPADALKLAVLGRHLAQGPDGCRMVLVNPGFEAQVWPWEQMDRLLPALDEALHLRVETGVFAQIAPRLIDAFSRVLDEFHPLAVLTLGASDAVLSCALTASKRGVPLVQLEAGSGLAAPDGHPADNGALIARMADLLVSTDSPSGTASLTRLREGGIDAERCRSVAGRLDADALAAVWVEVTTPYGAFMRHAMPIYLGPTWSEHAGDGTPYVVTSLTLDPADADRTRWVVEQLAGLDALPKCVWLLDARSEEALAALLDADPRWAEQVCLLQGDGPRTPAQRDRMDRTRLLCRTVTSLCDQLSILRGASCAIVEEGQLLAAAAPLLELPTIVVRGRALYCAGAGLAPAMLAEPGELNRCVQEFAAMVAGLDSHRGHSLDQPTGAALAVAGQLRTWLSARTATAQTITSDAAR